LFHGIQIGDRKYEFLAFGNSQIREQGAYFFAPLEHLNTSHIRAWMGEFGHIDVIAKYSARLGQCFSTTWAVTCPKVNFRKIDDVEREGPDGKNCCFTDGVGKISPFLARLATSELRGLRHVAEPPSVYQFRLGGCKGILAVDPKLANNEIHIRRSQDKFPAVSKGLEIISWSQYAPAHLNRQIILVLSSLGVSDGVFMKKLHENLASLSQALTDSTVSCRELQRIVDPNHVTLSLASMVIDGFQDSREPFVTSLLQLWRAWRVKYIKEKANISIPQSALLYGCVDETATLKGHFDELQSGPGQTADDMLNRLPEIFVQVSSPEKKGKYRLIEGVCLLARNPSLHPGDIRVVRAVNNPNLYHLKDVVVFPQTGDRDLAGMCSGGDLDGDDFLVIWDPELTPTEWNHPPMDYTPPIPLRAIGDVTISDVMAFFVNYMKNNRLGTIAHAHVAWADQLDEGVKSKKCK
jgi:RNA-dependent RNA polymerase